MSRSGIKILGIPGKLWCGLGDQVLGTINVSWFRIR